MYTFLHGMLYGTAWSLVGTLDDGRAGNWPAVTTHDNLLIAHNISGLDFSQQVDPFPAAGSVAAAKGMCDTFLMRRATTINGRRVLPCLFVPSFFLQKLLRAYFGPCRPFAISRAFPKTPFTLDRYWHGNGCVANHSNWCGVRKIWSMRRLALAWSIRTICTF